MGYTREERLIIGKQIYNNEINKSDAAVKYNISEGTARDYMRLYRDVNGLPPKNRIQKEESMVKISVYSSEPDLSEYEIILELSGEFPVKLLCETMSIQRSSFCHWKKRLCDPAPKTKALADNIILFQEYHMKYPSHGYRWLNAKIRLDTGLNVSDVRYSRDISLLCFLCWSRHAVIAALRITTLQKPWKVHMICSLYASVQDIGNSPFLPHGVSHGYSFIIIQRGDTI